MATVTQDETYVPVAQHSLDCVSGFLAKHEEPGKKSGSRYYLVAEPSRERVELPAEMYHILNQVAEAMQQGLAVTVEPQSQTLTTQQAADLLGVSRPTVVKLLEDGKIPYERIGSHRRVRLADVLTYREHRRAAQYAMLEATSIDDEEDLAKSLQRLKKARRELAERRRTERG